MGCAESVAVSRPMNNPAKANQLSKKRNKRRPSQEEQVLGELPQPGEFDPSQGQQEQRSHYSDNTSSGRSTQSRVSRQSNKSPVAPNITPHTSASYENPKPSSMGVEANPLALPPRRKSIGSMDDPEPSLLSIIGVGAGVVPDDNDAQPFVLGLGAEVYAPTGGDPQHDLVDIDEQPFSSSATSKDFSSATSTTGWIGGASANTAIYGE